MLEPERPLVEHRITLLLTLETSRLADHTTNCEYERTPLYEGIYRYSCVYEGIRRYFMGIPVYS